MCVCLRRYLLPAAIIAAGLDGLQGGAPAPPPPADINMYDATDPAVAAVARAAPQLPRSLGAALDALDASQALRTGLGACLPASPAQARPAWLL